MLEQLEKKVFPKVYEIMEQSFPKEEYRSYEDQLALLEREEYKLYGAIGSNGELMAFFAVWELIDFLFIEHFAVRDKLRNQGLGAQMIRSLQARYSAPMCLEVELPQNALTERRIAFYERNGFYLNHFPYEQPSLGAGRAAVPLRIMTSGGPLSEGTFRYLKERLYKVVYEVV